MSGDSPILKQPKMLMLKMGGVAVQVLDTPEAMIKLGRLSPADFRASMQALLHQFQGVARELATALERIEQLERLTTPAQAAASPGPSTDNADAPAGPPDFLGALRAASGLPAPHSPESPDESPQ